MRIFKVRWFQRWAKKAGLTDEALREAVREMEQGLVDVALGGHVYKKRIAAAGRGKSGSWRTIVVYRVGSRVVFIYGFSKSEQSNITTDELRLFKLLASELVEHDDKVVSRLIDEGELIEVMGL